MYTIIKHFTGVVGITNTDSPLNITTNDLESIEETTESSSNKSII